MKPNDDIQKELNELSPLLAKLKDKKEGYTVPSDYFSALADEIMENCVPEIPKPIVQPSFRERINGYLQAFFKPQLAMAFSLCALFLVAVFLFLQQENQGQLLAEEFLDKEELFVYINDNIDEFDLDLLSEDFNDNESFDDVFEINPTELEQYIEENVLDDLDEFTLEELL